MSKYPRWFRYEVNSFTVDVLFGSINKELVKLGIDAENVISISHTGTSGDSYEVFYRKRVEHA